MSPRTSALAVCLYASALLAGLKLLGVTALTWSMVLFPLWGLGIGILLLTALMALIIRRISTWLS